MFGIEEQGSDGGFAQVSEDRVGRMMTAQYNLSVQRGDAPQATSVLARMFGQWLANKFAR